MNEKPKFQVKLTGPVSERVFEFFTEAGARQWISNGRATSAIHAYERVSLFNDGKPIAL